MAERPSLQRKVTRKTEDKRRELLDEGVRLSLDGEEWVVRLGDVTPVLARRFRREMGMSFTAVIAELNDDPDIDSVGALIWLARLIQGDEVALDDVAITYADLEDIEVAEPGSEAADGSPEA